MRARLLFVTAVAVAALVFPGCLDFDQFLEDAGATSDVGNLRKDAGEDGGASGPNAGDGGRDAGFQDAADAADDSGHTDAATDADEDGAFEDAADVGLTDTGEDVGQDGGRDGGFDAGEEYFLQKASVYESNAGQCSNDEFELFSGTGWGAQAYMENDEFVSKGKVLFMK